MALVFGAPFRGSVTKFSFCIILRQGFMARYLTLHTLLQERLTQIILKFRILLMKVPELFVHYLHLLRALQSDSSFLFPPLPPINEIRQEIRLPYRSSTKCCPNSFRAQMYYITRFSLPRIFRTPFSLTEQEVTMLNSLAGYKKPPPHFS